MKKTRKRQGDLSRQMSLSDMPPLNYSRVCPEYRSEDPLAVALDRLGDAESQTYARIDLEIPMGCSFSLFVVRGWPKDLEDPSPMLGTLVISRDLALQLAEGLDQPEILEFPIHPGRQGGDDAP